MRLLRQTSLGTEMKETSEKYWKVTLLKNGRPVGVADSVSIHQLKKIEDFPVHRERIETKLSFSRIIFNKKIQDEFDVEIETWEEKVKRTFSPFKEIRREIPNTRRVVKYFGCFFTSKPNMFYIKNETYILHDVEAICLSGL